MNAYVQTLRFTPGISQIYLRELSGNEEQWIGGSDLKSAIRLVDQLMVKNHPSIKGMLHAQDLASADRDRVLAGIYQQTFGDQIQGTLTCPNCKEQFDLDFSLSALVEHTFPNPTPSTLPAESYQTDSGLQFRVPTGKDELEVLGLPEQDAAEHLLQSCLLDGVLKEKQEELEKEIEQLAPMLSRELEANCPECGYTSSTHFDVQHYLLQALVQSKKKLTWEVHRMASHYGWSLQEILSLARSDRKRYVQIIERELDLI